MKIVMMMNCIMDWLTDESALALFPAFTIAWGLIIENLDTPQA